VENLRCKIECLRQRMHVTALEKGISHPEVLIISCELDQLLNEFYVMSLAMKTIRNDDCSGTRLQRKLYLCAPIRKCRIFRTCQMIGQAVLNA